MVSDEIEKNEPETLLVGIGASAGGLEAIQALFSKMPVDTNLSFVIVQHLSPDYKSLMSELLAKHTDIPVSEAENGTKILPNHIYLIPPKNNMTVSDGFLILEEQNRSFPNLPINLFFSSMANEYGDQCIAIVLSGTGSDGSRGILDVCESGGLVIAQDPEEAKFDGMPKSALLTNCVNKVLKVGQMPQFLINYCSFGSVEGLTGPQKALQNLEEISGKFDEIFNLIYKRNKIDLKNYKSTTIHRRIIRRMKSLILGSVDDYITMLSEDPEEIDILTQDLIIGVTAFFRDEMAFAYLRDVVIPKLFSEATDVVRVWVCACSTGEEAYSLALLMEEFIEKTGTDIGYKIFASDLLPDSVAIASAGVYPEEIFMGLQYKDLVEKYFLKRDGKCIIKPKVRTNIVFTVHNSVSDAPFTNLNLVTCRNFLIYLKPESQQKLISSFYFGLKKEGVLFLGPSEHLGVLKEEFFPLNTRWKIFKKVRDLRLKNQSKVVPGMDFSRSHGGGGVKEGEPSGQRSIVSYEYENILKELIQNGIVLNYKNEVTHIFGPSKDLLVFPEGRVGGVRDVFHFVHPSLKVPLSTALRRSKKEQVRVVLDNIKTDDNGKGFNLVVKPLGADGKSSEHTLVLLEKSESEESSPAKTELLSLQPEVNQVISDLEADLNFTKETLQNTIEEFESTNEELQSTNEEMLAANEELQSTNEELQSVNEELYTVNSEHQEKIRELIELNEDMENLMASTQIGTIFVNEDFEIRKFTPAVSELFHIRDTDIGRSITHFTSTLKYKDLIADLESVVRNKGKVQKEVTDGRGLLYLLSITPYESKHTLSGAVLTFVDVTRIKEVENEIFSQREALDEAAIVAETDIRGNITYVNDKFVAISKYSREELMGKNHRIINSGHHPDEFFKDLWGTISKGSCWRGEICNKAKDGSLYWVDTLIYPQRNNFGQIEKYISIRIDISDRVKADAQIKSHRDYLERLQDIIYDGYWDWYIKEDYEYYSPRFWELLGYDPSTKKSHPSEWQKLIHPDDLTITLDNFKKHVETKGKHHFEQEVRYRHADGSIIWVNCRGKVVEWDSDGSPIRMIGTHTDITSQKLLQQKYELVLAGSSVGIWDWADVTKPEKDWSGKFYELLGYGPGEISPSVETFNELLHPDFKEETFARLEKHLNGDSDFDMEYQLKTKSGEYRWFRATGMALKDKFGVGVKMSGSIMDIHDRKMAEAALREEQIKMIQSAKMATIGEMAAGIAHEINNPLTVIKGKMQSMRRLLSAGEPSKEKLEAVADKIDTTVNRISSIIKGLKSFSRSGENEKLEKVKVEEIINETLDFCSQRLASEGISFKKPNIKKDLELQCRPVQVSQVLLNLIQNARDAIEKTEDPWIHMDVLERNGSLCIEVSDSGSGIPLDQRSKIFEPFYTTKEMGHGTGLGLSLSKELIENHSGKLYLDDKFPTTKFVIELPLNE